MRALAILAIALLGAVACEDDGPGFSPPVADSYGDAHAAFPDGSTPDVWGYEDNWAGHEAGPDCGEETSLPAYTIDPRLEDGAECPTWGCLLQETGDGAWDCAPAWQGADAIFASSVCWPTE